MKTYFVVTLLLLYSLAARAQTPTKCFEIESILVDACGTPEWDNEMVRIKIGPNPLNVSSMVIDWPNNSFKGICQNGTTASKTAAFNATILGCGFLKEPVGGVLPAGANVLIITSTNVSITANSFANLNDTLVVIYQCTGNNAGHFVNYNTTPGLRTLIIDFTAPANCGDTVTYDRALLVNQSGTSGGSSALNDGGRVDFSWGNVATYANDGCQAPVLASGINITTTSPLSLCPGGSLNLTAAPYGAYSQIIWTGGLGSFSTNTTTSTVYTSSASDGASFYLYAGIKTACSDTIFDSILVVVAVPTSKTITPTSYNLCPNETLTITATGGTSYVWSTLQTSNSIQVSAAGTYTVVISDGCYLQTLSTIVTNTGVAPTISLSGNMNICSGQSTTLTASGTGVFNWPNATNGTTFTTNQPGIYTVTATNACGTTSQNFTITNLGSAPSLSLSGDTIICDNTPTIMMATGGTNYVWSNQTTAATFATNVAGNYYVTSTNACGSDTVYFSISNQSVTADFTATVLGQYAPLPVQFTNNSVNATTYYWDFGNGINTSSTNPSTTYTADGAFWVHLTASNAFGCLATDSLLISVPALPLEIIIPNIFTPNGDGSNDVFTVGNTFVSDLSGQIYNRWGQLIHTQNELQYFSWNGHHMSGSQAPEGTYYYLLSITFKDGSTKEFTGPLLLVR